MALKRLLRTISPALLMLVGAVSAAPALAQASGGSLVDQTFSRLETLQQQAAARQRARNLARNTVVQLNGGLTRYMPAACMFSNGSSGPCLVEENAQGFLFRFNGGAPGWQQLNLPPTTSSEIQISPDGRSVVRVVYNGALR